MSDQQQRTAWAVEKFRDFVKAWTPPAARRQLLHDGAAMRVDLDAELRDGERVINAIKAIAPKDDGKTHVGWAVFKREHDNEYLRERKSGLIHTMISAVFEDPAQADNACRSQRKRQPDQHFIICEIREIP